MSEEQAPSPTEITPAPKGTLNGTPHSMRVIYRGKVMVVDDTGVGIWTGPGYVTLLDSIAHAKEVLVQHGYYVDENFLVRPLTEIGVELEPQTHENVGYATSVAVRRNAVPLIPVAEYLPEHEDAIKTLAESLPAGEPGDMIDVNRKALATAAWGWMLANKDYVRHALRGKK